MAGIPKEVRIRLSEDVRREAIAACKSLGRPMTTLVADAVRFYVAHLRKERKQALDEKQQLEAAAAAAEERTRKGRFAIPTVGLQTLPSLGDIERKRDKRSPIEKLYDEVALAVVDSPGGGTVPVDEKALRLAVERVKAQAPLTSGSDAQIAANLRRRIAEMVPSPMTPAPTPERKRTVERTYDDKVGVLINVDVPTFGDPVGEDDEDDNDGLEGS